MPFGVFNPVGDDYLGALARELLDEVPAEEASASEDGGCSHQVRSVSTSLRCPMEVRTRGAPTWPVVECRPPGPWAMIGRPVVALMARSWAYRCTAEYQPHHLAQSDGLPMRTIWCCVVVRHQQGSLGTAIAELAPAAVGGRPPQSPVGEASTARPSWLYATSSSVWSTSVVWSKPLDGLEAGPQPVKQGEPIEPEVEGRLYRCLPPSLPIRSFRRLLDPDPSIKPKSPTRSKPPVRAAKVTMSDVRTFEAAMTRLEASLTGPADRAERRRAADLRPPGR